MVRKTESPFIYFSFSLLPFSPLFGLAHGASPCSLYRADFCACACDVSLRLARQPRPRRSRSKTRRCGSK
jgi:hypothetical protein